MLSCIPGDAQVKKCLICQNCLFSSLWWLSIEVIPPRRRRLNDMTRMCMVETKSSCRFCGTHRDFRDRAIGHLTYICPKMAFFPSDATSLLQFGGCSLARCDRKRFLTYQMAFRLKTAHIPRKRRAVGLKNWHPEHPFSRPRPPKIVVTATKRKVRSPATATRSDLVLCHQ